MLRQQSAQETVRPCPQWAAMPRSRPVRLEMLLPRLHQPVMWPRRPYQVEKLPPHSRRRDPLGRHPPGARGVSHQLHPATLRPAMLLRLSLFPLHPQRVRQLVGRNPERKSETVLRNSLIRRQAYKTGGTLWPKRCPAKSTRRHRLRQIPEPASRNRKGQDQPFYAKNVRSRNCNSYHHTRSLK